MTDTLAGRELARRARLAFHGYVARAMAPLALAVKELREMVTQTPTMEMVRGEIDAMRGDLETRVLAAAQVAGAPSSTELRPLVETIVREMATPLVELAAREAALQAYRDARAQLEQALDRLPRPADGKDGASVEAFQAVSEGRRFMLGVRVGGKDLVQEFRLDLIQWQGVYRSGQVYEKSDVVTYGGSAFIALENVGPQDRPEGSRKWALFVKRGRDGRDAGTEGEE